jgi:hypothetical protein
MEKQFIPTSSTRFETHSTPRMYMQHKYRGHARVIFLDRSVYVCLFVHVCANANFPLLDLGDHLSRTYHPI